MSPLQISAPLDKHFTPILRGLTAFEKEAKAAGGHAARVALERNNGLTAVRELIVFPDGVCHERNLTIAERLLKSML